MIKPWIGYITIVDVEHEDKVTTVETGLRGHPVAELLGLPEEIEERQGVNAGAVVECGEGVPPIPSGAKVYYHGCAIEIGDVKIISAVHVVGWEEE